MNKLLILVLFAAFARIESAGTISCYFTSWTTYRPGNGQFTANFIDPFLCTHIHYAFLGLGPGGQVVILDDWEANGLHEFENLKALRDINPDLKILVSMGGWNEGSTSYSSLAASPTTRSIFVKNVLSFLNTYEFDGFELDWEYPNQRGGSPADVKNFVTLLSELKKALEAKNLLLSVGAACGIASADLSYDYKGVSDNVDLINVMCYDFQQNYVSHYSPFNASHLDQSTVTKHLNVMDSVKHWLDKGADPKKINLGVGTYGRGFTLLDPENTDLYAPILGTSAAGPYTGENGLLGYNEICELDSDWEYVWDDEQQVPHIIYDDQWVGYDDEKSLTVKTKYAKSLNLGGVMVWSLDTDDFRGLCGNGSYPLINAIKKAWEED